jgi:hypothetical protein
VNYVGQVKALYDYNAENEGDLSFKEGDIINIIDNTDPSGVCFIYSFFIYSTSGMKVNLEELEDSFPLTLWKTITHN